MRRFLPSLMLSLVVIGCAVRLGGPEPETYRTLALSAGPEADPAAVAAQITGARAEAVLLAAPRDSAFFAAVAAQAGLALSGPGGVDGTRLAFLTADTAVGDTTLALPLEGDGEVVVHDALYQIDKNRWLDLLSLRVEDPARVREVVRALLRYVATDVMPEAATVIAVDAANPAVGDSVAALLLPAFRSVVEECLPEQQREPAPPMRLFYGPEVRIDCEDARVLEGERRPLLAELVVSR